MVLQAFSDVHDYGSELKEASKLGEQQATVRDGVIQTINELADSLVLATDLIAKELSATIMEFQANMMDVGQLRGCCERLAARVSEPQLRLLLHEGKVCGNLHKLGDRFEQPFSYEAMAGMNIWENVTTFFRRSSSMSMALHGLIEGERDYLRAFADFLDEVRTEAEQAAALGWGQELMFKEQVADLIKLIQEKRQVLQDEARQVRKMADTAINTLH
jgi:hypothetical protein